MITHGPTGLLCHQDSDNINEMPIIRWNDGVNNWMVYATGDIPVGDYSSTNSANIGIGHGAIDEGGGYTYLNPQTGHEISPVTGFTYNFINPAPTTKTALMGTWIGALRNSCPSNFWLEQWAISMSRLAPMRALRSCAHSNRASSELGPAWLQPSAWFSASVHQCQAIWGICRARPAVRMERLADLVVFAAPADQSKDRNAHQMIDPEVTAPACDTEKNRQWGLPKLHAAGATGESYVAGLRAVDTVRNAAHARLCCRTGRQVSHDDPPSALRSDPRHIQSLYLKASPRHCRAET